MSEEEDDYLSDKFLAQLAEPPKKSGPTTYSVRRNEAAKRSAALNAANRTKSRRERELEAREEGLGRSLFERAAEDAAQGRADTGSSKALAMMMRMGFKPGESLGRKEGDEEDEDVPKEDEKAGRAEEEEKATDADERAPSTRSGHRVEPLPLNEWTGRKGIGLTGTKRALSPESAAALENAAKAAKHSEAESVDAFRDRTRREHEERRAEGRLRAAQQTCVNCDEAAGKKFNIFWLDPEIPDSFPPSLLDALENDALLLAPSAVRQRAEGEVEARLRRQMRADALQPLDDEGNVGDQKQTSAKSDLSFGNETIEGAKAFLSVNSIQRLEMVLAYLRAEYFYCFWCGTQYNNVEDLEANCPGEGEEEHD